MEGAPPDVAQADSVFSAAVRMQPDVVFVLFGVLPVTNTLLSAWLVTAMLILLALVLTRRLERQTRGAQNAWETFCEAWVRIVDKTIGPRGRRYVPLLGISFLYILFANWLGTLPLKHIKIAGPDGQDVALFRPATGDLNLTLAMAFVVILLVESVEIRAVGLRQYLRSLVLPNPFRALELITRPLSLALRLFGNIFAGEVLVGMILLIAPAVLFAVLGLELFVGLVQAVIFAALTLVFLSVAVAHEAHDAQAVPQGQPTPAGTNAASARRPATNEPLSTPV